MPITNGTCFEGYCTHLVPGLFPTPLYETIMSLLLFAALWWLRKRISLPAALFSLYLIMNGVERFLIENIRVNNLFIGTWTQAEVISLGLVLLGAGSWLWLHKRHTHGPATTH